MDSSNLLTSNLEANNAHNCKYLPKIKKYTRKSKIEKSAPNKRTLKNKAKQLAEKSDAEIKTDCNATENSQDKAVQVSVVSYKQEQSIKKLQLENKMFQEVNNQLESKILELRSKCQKVHEIVDSSEFHKLELVQRNAKTGSVKANFLMDQINNFDKRQPVWSDVSLKYCEEWRKASEKGYNYVRIKSILSCPSRSTLERYDKDRQNHPAV